MSVELLVDEKTRTADAILRVLADAGIGMVFGIAGGHTGRLFMALANHQNEIRTVLVREESLAGVMAEVVGRLTGRPGVIIGQGPWVLGNGLIGTLEAHLSSSPMLLLTDFSDNPGHNLHGPYQAGTGDWGTWNARQSFAGVTKQVFEAHDPAAGVQATQLAIKHAISGQPGPVAVLYAAGGLAGHVGPDSTPRLYRSTPIASARRRARSPARSDLSSSRATACASRAPSTRCARSRKRPARRSSPPPLARGRSRRIIRRHSACSAPSASRRRTPQSRKRTS
jgi:acetolactate synthase-1/2/3 large subunit